MTPATAEAAATVAAPDHADEANATSAEAGTAPTPPAKPCIETDNASDNVSTGQLDTIQTYCNMIIMRERKKTTEIDLNELRDMADKYFADSKPIPEDLISMIERSEKRAATATDIFRAQAASAQRALAAASSAHEAVAEMTALRVLHCLYGKNVPEEADLSSPARMYDPSPPQDIPSTDHRQVLKEKCHTAWYQLIAAVAKEARLTDRTENLRSRNVEIPEATVQALSEATIERKGKQTQHRLQLHHANADTFAAIKSKDTGAIVDAMRPVHWLLGHAPPTHLQIPQSLQHSEDTGSDTRSGKKARRVTSAPENTALVDLSIASAIVHHRACEAAALEERAKDDIIRAMEQPDIDAEPLPGSEDTRQDVAAMAAARSLAVNAAANAAAENCDVQLPSVESITEAQQGQLTLTKAQCIARDSNREFFKAVDPRLRGDADAIPCHKCDDDLCFLDIKSRGDLHPTYQAQLCGKKCGKTSAPSVCLQAWLANGTLGLMLNATAPAMATADITRIAQDAQKNKPLEVAAKNTCQADRANDMDAALLKMEQEAQDIATCNAQREKVMQEREKEYQREREECDAAFQRERSEHAKAIANANDILRTIRGNLSKIRNAQVNRTAVLLDPTPARYVPEVSPPPPVSHLVPSASYAQSTRRQQTQSGPGKLSPTAYPPISTQGPQIPRAPFQRSEVRLTYARALKVPPRQKTTQHRQTRRDVQCMNAVKFILITNFDHCPISQTKAEFAKYLEEGTDILHYRRMPFQGLEVAVPEYQLASISQQFRQMGFVLATNYLPTNRMARRRAGESVEQNADRQAHVAHRAFSKVTDNPRTQIAVKNWFARACADLEARYPHVFTSEGQDKWSAMYQKEAQERRTDAPTGGAPKPADTTEPADESPRTTTTPAPQPVAQPSIDKPKESETTANARDNAVPEDK